MAHGLLVELPNPDVPEADRRARIAMRLQLDRRGAVLVVRRRADVERLAFERDVILHENAVVKGGDERWRRDRSVSAECRRCPYDVVRLPFAWLPHRVH